MRTAAGRERRRRCGRAWGRAVAPLAALLGAGLAAGCISVGPDYSEPALPVPEAWAGAGASPEAPADLARWWEGLGDPLLADLVEEPLEASPDVRSARAALREARARRHLAGAQRLPSLGLDASARRDYREDSRGVVGSGSAVRSAGGSAYSNYFQAGLDATWELDLFGGRRRAVEAAEADLAAARVSLAPRAPPG